MRTYHLPHAYLYADAIAEGELPLWDPFTYAGVPFQANVQTQVFYPPMGAIAFLGSRFGQEHLLDLLEANVVFHVFLAGCFAFWLGRKLGLRTPGAFLLGTVFQLSGYFAAHADCGAIPLALAIWGLISRSSLRLLALPAVLLGVSLAVMLGRFNPAWNWIWSLLPHAIRNAIYGQYAAVVFVLSIAMLAAIHLETAFARPRLQWFVAILSAVDLIAVSSGQVSHALPLKNEPGVTRTSFDGRKSTLDAVRRLSEETFPPARCDSLKNTFHWAASSPITRIPFANGYDPMALERFIQVRLAFCRGERWGAYYEVDDLRSPILGAMNTRFLVSRDRIPDSQLRAAPVFLRTEIPGFYLYENRAVLPRFWLVSKALRAQTMEEASAALKAPDFDPSVAAIVETATPPLQHGPGAVRVLEYGLKTIEIEVETKTTRLLVSSEPYYPGWRVWVDGVEASPILANVAFRAVAIPPGKHLVRWSFEPPLFYLGCAISVLAWLVWAGMLFFCARRARRV